MRKCILAIFLVVMSLQSLHAQVPVDSLQLAVQQPDSLRKDSVQRIKFTPKSINLSGGISMNMTLIPLYDNDLSVTNKYSSAVDYRQSWGSYLPTDSTLTYIGFRASLGMARNSYAHSEGIYKGNMDLVAINVGYFMGARMFLGSKCNLDYSFGLNVGYSGKSAINESYRESGYSDDFTDFKSSMDYFLVGFDARVMCVYRGFLCGLVADFYLLDNAAHSGINLVIGYEW